MTNTNLIIMAVITVVLVLMLMRLHSVKLYRFYRPTCPWCVKSQAEWDKFSMSCIFSTVKAIDIDLNKPGSEDLAKLYKVTGVPKVVKVYPNGSFVEYSGDRTVEGYKQFAKK
jgi:hypothetical protein